MATLKKIAVFGAGGFGLEVAMLVEQINARSAQWEMIGFFDDGKPKGVMIDAYPLLGGMAELNQWKSELWVAFALGMPITREKVIAKIENPEIRFPVLVHPSVIVGRSAVAVGEGGIICAGCIITTHVTIGKQSIVNLGCTIGHETTIGEYCSFMPGCNISGEVTIGRASFWGTGAKIINRRSVGEYTVIGAGAVVTTDIPGHATAVGVPAKVIERAKPPS